MRHSREVDTKLEKQRKLLEIEQRLSRLSNGSGDTTTAAASAIPEVISGGDVATASTSVVKQQKSSVTSIPTEYLLDTFESAVPTTSFTHSNLLSHEVATSTPLSSHVTVQEEQDARAMSEAGKGEEGVILCISISYNSRFSQKISLVLKQCS